MKSRRMLVKEKKLIVSLITDHLRSFKLLRGLEELGFISFDYYLALPDTIFQLMGLKREKDFEYYLKLVEEAKHVGFQNHALDALALEIYFKMSQLRERNE